MSFGKADFFLGFPLSTATEIVRPAPLVSLADENVLQLAATKYHSLALTRSGAIYSWGYGKSGRLGHGNEDNQLLPMPVFALRDKVVVSIAAADNHTIAITQGGGVYGWGSNTFGQLGTDKIPFALSPVRVEFFRKVRVVGCAAGALHSICYTEDDEVFAFGCNKSGQLGVAEDKVQSATPRKVALDKPLRLRKTMSKKEYRILQTAAGHDNSLLLIKFAAKTYTDVYQWGSGSPLPSKVRFSLQRKQSQEDLGALTFQTEQRGVVVQVCAGRSHNVAVMDSGHVYTWGLGSDRLGHGFQDSHLSTPQLVESLLPERGGGRVVFASACANRSCVVTSCHS